MNQTLTRHTATTGVRTPAAPARSRSRTADATRPIGRRQPVRTDARRPVARPGQGIVCGDARRQAPPAHRPAPVRWVFAALVGVGLAVVVWMMVIGGSVAADSNAPAVSGTQVVHVRGGESLGALAERVAPEQSTSTVVASIRDLNHMDGSALTAGQPLLAPVYRH